MFSDRYNMVPISLWQSPAVRAALWLCKIRHVSGHYIGTFYAVNGYSGIKNHFLNLHKINPDAEQVATTAVRASLFGMLSAGYSSLGIRDFNHQQRSALSSIFPEWVIQLNL